MKDIITDLEPTKEALLQAVKRRKFRKYQRRSRGGINSASDAFENAAIALAWEAAELTEGQAMRALGVDRVAARELKLRVIAFGRSLAHELI